MAAYGYTQPKYGSSQTPRAKPLAPGRNLAAAAGAPTAGDPFGLLNPNPNSQSGPRVPNINGSVISSAKPQVTQAPVAQPPSTGGQQAQGPQAPTPATYDINADPVLQQVNAYATLSDEQARAQSLNDQRDAAVSAGLEEVARSIGGDTLAQAAAQNPNSSKARLDKQKDTGLHDLLAALTTGGHNLGYSGYRTTQEGQIGDQYQSQLADLASGLNSRLGGYRSALLAALGASNDRRAGALGDAFGRQSADALAHPMVAASGPDLNQASFQGLIAALPGQSDPRLARRFGPSFWE